MQISDLDGAGDRIARAASPSGDASWLAGRADHWYLLQRSLSELCADGVGSAHTTFERAAAGAPVDARSWRLLAPVDPAQEVWAAGVTYERSRTARIEESGARDLYASVYESPRPELFFKATGRRVVGTVDAVAVRRDARWTVPEPELAVVCDAGGDVLGFTIADDVSSRDIEGANALYLPQAKVYDRSCSLGPAIVPVWSLGRAPTFTIELQIIRRGETLFAGEASTAQMRRGIDELSRWLRACLTFDDGVVLLTGTGIVPGDDVTLVDGDEVAVRIGGLGELRNPVVTTGVVVDA